MQETNSPPIGDRYIYIWNILGSIKNSVQACDCFPLKRNLPVLDKSSQCVPWLAHWPSQRGGSWNTDQGEYRQRLVWCLLYLPQLFGSLSPLFHWWILLKMKLAQNLLTAVWMCMLLDENKLVEVLVDKWVWFSWWFMYPQRISSYVHESITSIRSRKSR